MTNSVSMWTAGLKRTSKLWVTTSADETLEVGRSIAKMLPKATPLCLFGELGAGKTTLIKGFASELTGIDPLEVNSPTFTYLNIYEGSETLYHFDLYRLTGSEDFLSRGFDEYFEGVCCIEWAEKIEAILPKGRALLKIRYLGEEKREIFYEV
ncbi:MAG: tRNA threonylcarbamoyladenosine biosynthesis protein TsaE [Chlamydiae bacterium]|nr:tRNA threonylcarbamoyladenosine biosynthesis protein TsaE [Chlamydiota bacterium]